VVGIRLLAVVEEVRVTRAEMEVGEVMRLVTLWRREMKTI
jgi:hypothetical protein